MNHKYNTPLAALLLVICLLIASCNPPEPENTPTPAPTSSIQVTEGAKASPDPAGVTATPSPSPLPVKESTRYNVYNIVVDIEPDTRTVTGVEKVSYKNRTGMALEQIYFNLYLNAFNRAASAKPYFETFEPMIFQNGKDYGYINITGAMINNEGAVFSVKDTVLTITLPEPLQPEDELEITIVFDAYVPMINHRVGANETVMWMGNFFPILALYDANGWHKNPYYPAGDPFYANIANYNVKVNTPPGYVTVATGEEVSSESSGVRTTTITATLVRDFAFAVSKGYTVETLKNNSGVYVNLYRYTDAPEAELLLDAAVRTLETYSARIGSYPYTSLDIVEVGMLPTISGTEYPGIIFIDTGYFTSETKRLSLARDIAHQWFYNIIGSNQIKEAWLDEGLAEYVSQGFLHTPEELVQSMSAEYDLLAALLPSIENKTLLQDLSVYKSWNEYKSIQQTRAKLMMYALEQKIGLDAMNAFLKLYYTNYAFRLVNKNDFIATVAEVTEEPLDDFFRGWLEDFALPPLFPNQKQ